ncbi:MAG: PKD domain-containing protein [Bacteroidetes bacterium]|nr:PKD domain-containing protein [Bacteroidota bacterium]
MIKKLYLTLAISTYFIASGTAQQAIHYAALNQSVIQAESAQSSDGFAVFMTMESMMYDENKKDLAVRVTIEQPVCTGQKGVLALVNPSGANWQYKVMDKKGNFIGEGAVGYNRRIGELAPGAYFVQFTLPDGTSAIDEFKVKEAKGIQVALEAHPENKYVSGGTLSFTGLSDGANEFAWDFGDGSPIVYGKPSVEHTYATPGSYTVKFTANNFDCQDTAEYELKISGPVAFDKSEY